ncbi:MAG TPA: cystathionine beta-synthase [Bacteroidota bacterium]
MDTTNIQYCETILDAIGRTPLIRLRRVAQGVKGLVLAKAEFLNPGGSVKDRIGRAIVEEAEAAGRLKPGGTVVESTSGNTGMGIALVAAVKGYRTIFTLPDKMSNEKIRTLRAFGAEVIVTPTAIPHDAPGSYTEVAKRMARETPNAILADQYENPRNPESHYRTTGPELWEQTAGRITHFVCGIGTGGTISGTGKFLKERNPAIKVIGIDPQGSVLREAFYTHQITPVLKTYKVEGIGQDYVPGVLDFAYVDEVIEVSDRESFLMARRLTREEGLFTGGSSGTAVAGLLKIADRFTDDDIVVVLLPDSGERYISKIYNDDWMRENGFLVPERVTPRYILESRGDVSMLVSIGPDELVRRALELIRDHDISQLPVLEGGQPVGSLQDNELMSAVLQHPEWVNAPVRTVMGSGFPAVSIDAPLEDVVRLMTSKKNPAVLVEEDGAVRGILTRYDVIEYLSR